jgi:hypothetical protein
MASTELSSIVGGGNTLPQLTRARDINIDAAVGDRVFYDPASKKITTEYQGMSDIFKIDYYSSGWHPDSAVCYNDEPISVKTSDGLYHVFVLANINDTTSTSHFLQAFTCVDGDGHVLKNTASTAFTTTSGVIGNMAIGSAARVGATDDYLFLVGEAFIDTGTNAANFCRATWNTSTQLWTFTRNTTSIVNNVSSVSMGIIDVVYHATSSSVFAFLPDGTSNDIKFFRYDLAGDTVTSGTVSAGTPRRAVDQVKDVKKFSNVSMTTHVLSDDKFLIFGRLATGGVYSWSGSAFNLDQANPISINQSGEAYTALIDNDPDAFIRMEDTLNLGNMDWRVFRYSGGTLTETAVQSNVDVTVDGRATALNVGSVFRWVGNNTFQNFNGYGATADNYVVNITINDDDSFTARSGIYFSFFDDTDYKFNFHEDEDGITTSFANYVGTNSTNIGYMAVVRGSVGAFTNDYRPIPFGYISAIDGTNYTYDVDDNFAVSKDLTAGNKYGKYFALTDTILLLQNPIVANYKRLNRSTISLDKVSWGNTMTSGLALGDQKSSIPAAGTYALKAPEYTLSAMLKPYPTGASAGTVFQSITCDGLVFETALTGSISTATASIEVMSSQSSIKTQAVMQVGLQAMEMVLTIK